MRSPAQEAGRLARYVRNRRGIGEGALPVPSRFRPLSHRYAGYAGPWIEDAFYAFWRARRPAAERVYVPVFWTDYYLRHGRLAAHRELQDFLDGSLSPERRYFTIVQNDDGVLERLPPNVLVYGAGAGDVPIPLLGRTPPRRVERPRDVFCSFMGATSGPSDRFGVRSALESALAGKDGFLFGRGTYEEFVDMTSRSTFALAPRGYGPSSYRLYEAMALGAVPVYVWADVEWLPWQEELDWEALAVRVNARDIGRIPELLRGLSADEIAAKRQAAAAAFEDYFTLRGTCERIVERLRQGNVPPSSSGA
jgi:hypothetical protein